ncbi:MAG: hypothetical protein NT120_00360 [Candidatus Aenigmarchaeota archaeon]|nr:hypothetical protein [Candidatus Aenigmarchaeota archaeon]
MKLICPFCEKEVETEYESLQGCRACAEEWMSEERSDHDAG